MMNDHTFLKLRTTKSSPKLFKSKFSFEITFFLRWELNYANFINQEWYTRPVCLGNAPQKQLMFLGSFQFRKSVRLV